MMIGHISDLHITEGPRFAETVKCIEYAIEAGTKAGVELWLITGDIFGTRVPYHATELERLTFAKVLRRMGIGVGICGVLVYGNHDAPLALDLYSGLGPCVISAPRLINVNELSVIAFPYPSKRWVVGAEGGRGIEELRLDLGQRLFEILRGLLLSVETDECIIAGHCSVGGARIGGGEILAGQEIELSKAQLLELFEIQPKLRYIGLGHIHQAQQIVPGAWYAGTPGPYGYDGCNEHGFLLIDTQIPEAGETSDLVQFIPIPASKYYTIDVEWREDECGWSWGRLEMDTPEPAVNLRGARVKLRPRIPESQRKAADYNELVDRLRAEGAIVLLEPCIIPHARARTVAGMVPPPKDFIARGNASLREGLAALWQSQTPQPAMTVQGRALALLDE